VARPRFEVADVVRAHGEQYCHARSPSAAQRKVLGHLETCRTAVLGGHLDECPDCAHQRPSYNSCRDRHCPKCQGPRRAEWLAGRLTRLVPTRHFHVVFTLPDELRPLVLGNKRLLYGLLFKAASQTLKELAADPKHLGAQLGFTAVLHTWGQKLGAHPHLHCVVTGGGLTKDGKRWVRKGRAFLLPVPVLSKLFRGKFLDGLQRAWQRGQLRLGGTTAELADPHAWAGLRDRLYRQKWVVYAKRPFGGPKQVFAYLGRYTHRVAITNHRLEDISDGAVRFSYRDYADDGRKKTLQLTAMEFLRRFLLHTLPKGFVRIRHYGLYAGSNVKTKLAAAQALHAPEDSVSDPSGYMLLALSPSAPWWDRFLALTGIDVMVCPHCGGRLVRRQTLTAATSARAPPGEP
jgi:hypothetical protein